MENILAKISEIYNTNCSKNGIEKGEKRIARINIMFYKGDLFLVWKYKWFWWDSLNFGEIILSDNICHGTLVLCECNFENVKTAAFFIEKSSGKCERLL